MRWFAHLHRPRSVLPELPGGLRSLEVSLLPPLASTTSCFSIVVFGARPAMRWDNLCIALFWSMVGHL